MVWCVQQEGEEGEKGGVRVGGVRVGGGPSLWYFGRLDLHKEETVGLRSSRKSLILLVGHGGINVREYFRFRKMKIVHALKQTVYTILHF